MRKQEGNLWVPHIPKVLLQKNDGEAKIESQNTVTNQMEGLSQERELLAIIVASWRLGAH